MFPPGPVLPLPKQWPDHVRPALLHAVALAQFVLTHVRAWVVDSPSAPRRLLGDRDALTQEIALLREELRLKDARWLRIPARNRPHFRPHERLSILALQAARRWNQADTARRFALSSATIGSWHHCVETAGESGLVKTHVPVNRFPQFVLLLVQQLGSSHPTFGRRRIAQLLARAGLHLSAATVARFRDKPPAAPEPMAPAPAAKQPDATGAAAKPEATSAKDKPKKPRRILSRYPHHIWHADITFWPTACGFWVPWLPHAVRQSWPFAWALLVVMDNFSRRILAVRVFRRNPTSEQVQHLFEDLIVSLGQTPKYIISDQGQQFRERYRDWCATWNVKPRFGAIGQHGSIAIVERAILTLKSEGLRWLPVVPWGIAAMQDEVDCFVRWYDQQRPHQTLCGETPSERYGGLPPARGAPRYEPRARYLSTYRVPKSAPAAVRGERGTRLELVVQPFEGRQHLPIVELRVAA